MRTNKPEDFKDYYGKNYIRAFRTYHHAQADAKKTFIKNYPGADITNFVFQPDLNDDGTLYKTNTLLRHGLDFINIESDLFRNNKDYLTYLGPSKQRSTVGWPKMWDSPVSVQKLQLDDRSDLTSFPRVRLTKAKNFMAYVNANDYFMTWFPPVVTKLPKTTFNVQEPYFAAILGMYIATYL